MRITWRDEKRRENLRKHRLDFTLASEVFADPLATTVFDRVVHGEERWHTIGTLAFERQFKVIVVVYCYPDPDDETHIHVISLREATRHERNHYEISRL